MSFRRKMNSQQQKARLTNSDWSKTKLKQQDQHTTSGYDSKSRRISAKDDLKQSNTVAS